MVYTTSTRKLLFEEQELRSIAKSAGAELNIVLPARNLQDRNSEDGTGAENRDVES